MAEEFNNPFTRIRAEQMGDSAWKYFVKEPLKLKIAEKPIIFEGSRGTGKTMFFRCNSWREKYGEAISKGDSLEKFIKDSRHIGFYYKADGRFTKSFERKNVIEETWIGIFNTYFNIVISKEIISFIKLLTIENLIKADTMHTAIKQIADSLDQSNIANLEDLNVAFDNVISKIEKFSNNTDRERPVGLNPGTIIEKLLLALKQNEILKSVTFHIFVDEFEVLNQAQQIELNTLLKQSDSNIVYDYSVINKGILTYKTGSGQKIQIKDDFFLLSTDNYNYHESDDYNRLLIDICKKRLKEQYDSLGSQYDEKFLLINTFLKSYGPRYEEPFFEKAEGLNLIKARLKEEIKRHCRIYQLVENEGEFENELINSRPLVMRMHLALLMRTGMNAIPIDYLVTQKRENSKEYKEWIHNMEPHLVYLLCHELNIEKSYHGFKVYSALSSGVIRSFLELVEFAFDYAFNSTDNPFTFSTPREFTIEEQTKAVYFISNYKISEIDSYEPGGFQLKTFAIALGEIFKSYHTNSRATLGEVEQNHFTTNVNNLQKNYSEAHEMLNFALRHKILEQGDSNKMKSGIEFFDYHLNHIYCPAFGISHLRKRKIVIAEKDLAKLLCGYDTEIREVVRKLCEKREDDSPNLFSEQDAIPR